ncbi:MAG: divalent metal cation transporter, partial [Pedobacter sp.]
GISSVVGSAYTSISFIKSFHPTILKYNREIITGFIITSCVIFVLIGKPIKILIAVGAINGLILPIALGVMLWAAYQFKIVDKYKQPLWLTITGAAVVAIMIWMGYGTIIQMIGGN